ncbi:sugar transferase (plasmid) [Salipiger sp. H15]|uniref:Sugar transferase n=1 Tax=Alloyangia sp. H15 TaxID=3029062 RepID=A0AAU8ARY9_9RHOB
MMKDESFLKPCPDPFSEEASLIADEAAQVAARTVRSDLVKRAVDVTGASLLIVFLLPVFLLITASILLLDGGPVYFRHQRIGRNDREFGCLKFRTMRKDGDKILAQWLADHPDQRREWNETQKLRKDPRVHVVGRLLRKSSLDELPQLFNVLAGQMSLVGPRPVVRDELPRYGAYVPIYLSLRPGITGLWQVSGRNNTTYDERVAFDVDYAARRTLALDLGILFRTARVVLTGYGAY